MITPPWPRFQAMVSDQAAVGKVWLRHGIAWCLSVCNAVLPKVNYVLIAGSPPEEGNAVEIVRAILSQTSCRVHWIDAPDPGYLEALGFDDVSRVTRVPGAWSFRTMWTFLRARTVFYTHGLLGQPRPGRGQTVVNLWHGEGPKGGGLLFPDRRLTSKPATWLIGGCKAMASYMTDLARMSVGDYLWTGYPRIDQLSRPVADERLIRLGIDPSRPFVMWMPTFRRARSRTDGVAWSNTADNDADAGLAQGMSTCAERLRAAGIDLVVKPHPLDIEARQIAGCVRVDNQQLREAGVGLNQLLGRSLGLVSDYSAVWVEYLCTDKPIGFFLPDVEAYRQGRGQAPPMFDFDLPGVDLNSEAAINQFVAEVSGSRDDSRALRQHAIQRLGLRVEQGAADRVVSAVLAP